MAEIDGENAFTQLTKLNVIDKLLVNGNEVVGYGTELVDGQIFKYDSTTNSFIYAGATVDDITEEWTFDKSINVPQASVKISDTLSVSEATFAIFTRDNVAETSAVNATAVIRDEGTDQLQFLEAPSKQVVIAQPLFNTEFNANPFTAQLLSTLSNQTDAVTIKVASAMTNVRMTITDDISGVIIKYIPDKATVVSGIGGLNLIAGDNRIDFNSDEEDVPASGLFHIGFTPLRQFASQASTFMITGDSVSILGEPGGIPFFRNEIQFLQTAIVPTLDEVTNLADNYTRLNNEYVTAAATTAGLVVNFEATETADTVTSGQFTAGDTGTSNPTIVTDGSDTFAQGDIIQISGSRLVNGFFEVEDHTGMLLTVRGVGTIPTVEAFTRGDLVDTVDDAVITKINVSVLRTGTDGLWEVGKGSVTGIVFEDVVIGAGGSDTEVQFNNSGEFDGISGIKTDGTNLLVETQIIGAGAGGILELKGADNNPTGGGVLIEGGVGSTSGGDVEINAGQVGSTGSGGNVQIKASDGGTISGPAGDVTLLGGDAVSGDSGIVTIQGGTSGDQDPGDVFIQTTSGSVGIGTATLDGSAILEVTSDSKGFLMHRMPTTERDNISSPATGLEIFNVTNNEPEYFNGTFWVPTSGIFGTEYQYEASESESTTSSTTFQNKVTLTTPTIPAGFYRVEITYEVTNDSGDKPVVTQTTLDAVEFNESAYAPKFEDEYLVKTSFAAQALTNDTHEIELNFRATSEGGTAKIRRARIELFRAT